MFPKGIIERLIERFGGKKIIDLSTIKGQRRAQSIWCDLCGEVTSFEAVHGWTWSTPEYEDIEDVCRKMPISVCLSIFRCLRPIHVSKLYCTKCMRIMKCMSSHANDPIFSELLQATHDLAQRHLRETGRL